MKEARGNKTHCKVAVINHCSADSFLIQRALKKNFEADFKLNIYSNYEDFQQYRHKNLHESIDVIIINHSTTGEQTENVIRHVRYHSPQAAIIIAVEVLHQKRNYNFIKQGCVAVLVKKNFSQDSLGSTLIQAVLLQEKMTETVRKANFDVLTGLANRAFLRERIEHAISISRRSRKVVALMLIDLDDFKIINDTYGHDVGDQFLQAIAKRLQLCTRSSDTVARLGGDEFAVLLEGIENPEITMSIAKKMIASISKELDIRGVRLIPSASIGVSMLHADKLERFSYEWLYKSADISLYEAKENGKNQYSVFTDEQDIEMLKALSLQDELVQAIKNHEFIMHYQPIYSISRDCIVGMEALIRWPGEHGQLMLPDKFLGTVENMGMMRDLGALVIDLALRQYAGWIKQGLHVGDLHLNVSAAQFSDDSLSRQLKALLSELNIEPQSIKLELTEQNMFHPTQQMNDEFQRLYKLGVRFAIDDFGVGYSSYDYIRRFKIHTLKLDKSFVASMFDNTVDMAIVQSVIKFAQELSIEIIAEGIEDTRQCHYLNSLGVDVVQGYYFSRPMEADSISPKLLAA